MAPKAATAPSETHAALALVAPRFSGTLVFSGRARTVQQLRVNTPPNPWECVWIVWNYRDNDHFYYLALKPTGWELGKRDPAYPGGQHFLASSNEIALPVGAWASFRIEQRGNAINASVNGFTLVAIRDTTAPLYDSGQLGVYTEDARIEIDRLTLPDGSDGFANAVPRTVCTEGTTDGYWTFPFLGYGSARIVHISN